jgi:hypothetical protein
MMAWAVVPTAGFLVRPCGHVSIVGSLGIMRAGLFWLIVIGFGLTACTLQRGQIANDIGRNVVGLSKEQVLACMGPPLNKGAEGETEVWSYREAEKAVRVLAKELESATIQGPRDTASVSAVKLLARRGTADRSQYRLLHNS